MLGPIVHSTRRRRAVARGRASYGEWSVVLGLAAHGQHHQAHSRDDQYDPGPGPERLAGHEAAGQDVDALEQPDRAHQIQQDPEGEHDPMKTHYHSRRAGLTQKAPSRRAASTTLAGF